MPDIEIDASRLTVPSFTVPEAGTGPIDGSATPPPTVTLPAPGTYHLKQASAPVCDVAFSVSADGTLDFDTALDSIAEGRGTRRLTLHGLPVHLDATALDHDLSLQIGGPALTADRPHDLVLLPCREYLLGGGRGTLAFTLPVSGSVGLDPQTSGFASASGTALTVRGHTIRIDATALSHNVEPTSLPRVSFLPRARVNELTVLPADGFSFYVGSSFLADLKFDVGRDGQISVAPEYAGFATAAGDTLVLRGRTIRIDGTALSHDVEPTGAQMSFLPRASVNELTMLPAKGYGFYAGPGSLADLKFDVGRDGPVTVAPEFAGCASTAGDTLVLTGCRIRIDGTALSHDVLPWGLARPNIFLPRTSVNELTVLPAKGYGFYAGSGFLADLKFDVGRDGQVTVAPEFAECASAAGDTLMLRGCRIRIDGTALSHDVLPWGLARPNVFLPRTSVNELTVLPAKKYDFFSGPGYLADLQFGVGRDGQITVAPEFTECASAAGDTLVLTGCRIRIDGTALSHDVLPWGLARPNIFLPRTSVNDLTVLPAKKYDFFSGPGYLADLQFGVGRDGQITVAPEFT
ncbi:hypothetical protein, partial [Streptomyces sp. NPDC059378]|uniref:hypothetical protein n=1 Tax=Streptomyces sp. NPDC059378 TaxID=3346815 RepID=UPI0036C19186